MHIVLLDAGPLGLASNSQSKPEARQCAAWIAAVLASANRVAIPAITEYVVRRELIRAGKLAGLQRLQNVIAQGEYASITDAILHEAADLWAYARQHGFATANDQALDADVILAAQARALIQPGWPVVVATSNVRHLSRYVPARRWQEIAPADL